MLAEQDAMTILDALDFAARSVRDYEYDRALSYREREQLRDERLDRIQAARLAVRELRGR